MALETGNSKIWIRFEAKNRDGDTVKLRIQDLPSSRFDDFLDFYTTYFIKDEAIHKAAGISKNTEAIEEYKDFLTSVYSRKPPHISICCIDDDSENSKKILAMSSVQLVFNKSDIEKDSSELGIEFKTEEMKAFIRIIAVMVQLCPKSVKERYQSFHEGRGIIVHPDYRGLGIASQMVKQRRLLLQEYQIPMTYAWMTSIGSQKAAERDGWETIAEVPLEELDELTGLCLEKSIPTYKLMMATLDS